MDLKPLSNRHELVPLPFVKELRILLCTSWFLPDFFHRRGSRHFFAFADVQNLMAQHVEIANFIPRLGQYFGHPSPTLRPLTLVAPRCTPLQLSNFISLFPSLDDTLSPSIPSPSLQPKIQIIHSSHSPPRSYRDGCHPLG